MTPASMALSWELGALHPLCRLWRRRALIPMGLMGVLLMAGACGTNGEEPGEVVAFLEPQGEPEELPVCMNLPAVTGVEVVAEGLETPWAMAGASDGRVFLTERPGRIRVIEEGVLRPEPWFELPVREADEVGLMGLALHPRFEENGYLFVMGTFPAPGSSGPLAFLGPITRRLRAWFRPWDEGTASVSRIYRITDRDGQGVDPERVVDRIPARIIHGGGAMAFDDVGRLIYAVGDGMSPWSSQNEASLLGKLLRVDVDEALEGPGVEPYFGEIVASGVRNSQGIAVHPSTGDVFFIEHGPSGMDAEGGRRNRDELNHFGESDNYGWPMATGAVRDSRFRTPIYEWTPAIAPAGLALAETGGPGGEVVAYVAGLRGRVLVRMVLSRNEGSGEWVAGCQDRLLPSDHGRLRSVLVEPDGSLLVATSNRDGRGMAGPQDDRVLRVRFGGEPP